MEDVASWGAAGAGALMLGLANLGADENGSNSYLSNLAMGLDESRTLPNAGIDVFEHPDYTQQSDPANLSNSGGWTSYQDAVAAGCTDVMSEEEFLNALASGDPRVSGYSNYQEYLDAMYSQYNNGVGDGQIDPFNLQSANELDSEGANGTSFAAGFGALAGAAAVGGLAAGAVMGFNGDEANGGGVNGSMNSQFGLNGSNGLDDEDGSKSLFDIIFGTIDENDEEERKKQSLRERIALIAMAATSTSGLATFLLANFGTISPVWFTIALLLFGLALFYFNLVKDKKNKRREELDAMKKMTRQGFFNRTNPQNTPAPAVKEVDWVLFGMVLLSTSAFILKTYDVISWLLFLILLILFLLIIFAYVIIKKKMGEEENGVPYQK
jgi:cbb3-type cytochrome oxidase subunit 3